MTKGAGFNEDGIVCMFPVGEDAEFPGGEKAWNAYLYGTIRYLEPEWTGRIVVDFEVGANGMVDSVSIRRRDHGADEATEMMGNEVVRVIRASARWKAAVLYGKEVSCWKRQEIYFRNE